jgi:hypothetical protein
VTGPTRPPVSARQFAAFRIAFGSFLGVWFAVLAPWAATLFGDGGLAGLPAAPRAGFRVPSPIAESLPDPFAVFVLFVLAMLGGLIAAGVVRRGAALVTWLGLVWLYDREPAIHNPALAFVGWLCLALVLIPVGEPWRLSRRPDDPGWRLPRGLFAGAWWVLALAYGVSGLDKLSSVAWRQGEAIPLVLELPWARPGIARSFVLSLPDGVQHALTWYGLGAELLFPPLAAWRVTRPLAWAAGLSVHLGLLVLMDFPELSLGMVLAHGFTFDGRWLDRFRRRRPKAAADR